MTPTHIRWLLAPLLLWAGHFFIGYGFALALPTSALLDTLIVALTVIAVGALWWVWRKAATLGPHRATARQAVLIAAAAVAWQGLVVLF